MIQHLFFTFTPHGAVFRCCRLYNKRCCCCCCCCQQLQYSTTAVVVSLSVSLSHTQSRTHTRDRRRNAVAIIIIIIMMSDDSTNKDSKSTNNEELSLPLSFPKCTADFWNSCQSMIDETSRHPFLTRMVNGTLEESKFRYYVLQDALYLHDFADCLRRLSTRSSNVSDAESLQQFAQSAEEAELDLHRSFFQQWNIVMPKNNIDNVDDIDDNIMQNMQMPNCLLYTSYMQRIVTTRPYAQGLAVLLPCFWVYQHVGQCMLQLRSEIQQQQTTTTTRLPQYDAWIDMYGGDDFAKQVQDYIQMVDAECERILQEETPPVAAKEQLQEMQRHFTMSCKLEHMFWDQALYEIKWPTVGGGM
jgi:thiaminase (transcriptional activator TenA)